MTKIFGKYWCKGFYKKVHDGVCVALDKKNLRADWINTKLWDQECEGVVEKDIETAEKTYFEYVSQNFTGVVVGFVDLIVEGYLDVNYEDAIDTGLGTIPERFYVSKRAKTVIPCAIVYYSNNKKHYVPVDDLEEIL